MRERLKSAEKGSTERKNVELLNWLAVELETIDATPAATQISDLDDAARIPYAPQAGREIRQDVNGRR